MTLVQPSRRVLWESAVEAAWKSWLFLIMGQVAVSIVGGIFQEMTPSLLPGFGDGEVHQHGNVAFHWHWHQWSWPNRNTFVPVFVVFFAIILWTRWRSDPGTGRLHKIARAFRQNWFHVMVGNAFGAMITALVAMWVQQFSWVQFVWHSVMEFIMPAIHRLLDLIVPQAASERIGSWIEWYGQNQARFNFWIIYLAAICDDFGIPSIKTLGRWLWRKTRKRTQPQITADERRFLNREIREIHENETKRHGGIVEEVRSPAALRPSEPEIGRRQP